MTRRLAAREGLRDADAPACPLCTKKKKEVEPAQTLTPKKVEALMKEIEKIDPKSTVTMALCFFAGLRSDEVASIGGKPGLDGSDIDLDKKKNQSSRKRGENRKGQGHRHHRQSTGMA